MNHKHIDPEPDRRYLIELPQGQIESATVIEATDHHVRLHWDGTNEKTWYRFESFLPMPNTEDYLHLRIVEQLEIPKQDGMADLPPMGRHCCEH